LLSHLFLLEPLKISHWRVLLDRPLGLLISFDIRNRVEPFPECLQFGGVVDGGREDRRHEVQYLIHHEIHDRKIPEVPPIRGALVLVVPQDGLDSVLKNGGHLLGVFLEGAYQPLYGALQVVLAFNAVDLYLIAQGAAHQIAPPCLLHEVQSYGCGAGDDKGAVPEVGQVSEGPIFSLVLLVPAPRVGREEAVLVVDVQHLAQEAGYLRLRADWVVAQLQLDREGVLVLAFVGPHQQEYLLFSEGEMNYF